MDFKCGNCGEIIRDDDNVLKVQCTRCGGKVLYKRRIRTTIKKVTAI